MSGLEIVGVVLAGPPIVAKLLQVSLDGYEIFRRAQKVSKDLQKYETDLMVAQHHLESWVRKLGNSGGNLELLLKDQPDRYLTVLTILGMIAQVFGEVDLLRTKYSIERKSKASENKSDIASQLSSSVEHEPADWLLRARQKVITKLHLHRRAKSTSELKKLKDTSSSFADVTLVEDDKRHLAVGQYQMLGHLGVSLPHGKVEDTIKQLEQEAIKYQKTISTYHAYKWVFLSRDKLKSLIHDLEKYISQLDSLMDSHFNSKGLLEAPREVHLPRKLPFPRDFLFAGREDEIDGLKKALHDTLDDTPLEKRRTRRRTVVLNGMGGVGKSELVLEYVYRYGVDDYSTVLWLKAENVNSINSEAMRILEILIAHYANIHGGKPDYHRISTEIGSPGRIDPSGKVISDVVQSPWVMVCTWLEKTENNWCLVMDGIDDIGAIPEGMKLLPSCDHGHVIITSRDTTISNHDYVRADSIVKIEELTLESGLELLVKVLSEARNIVQMLGGLPLALGQAAAYICSTGRGLVQYAATLRSNIGGNVLRKFKTYQHGVFSCFKLSVEAAKKKNPNAAQLLWACAFLVGEDIPEELFTRGIKSLSWAKNSRTCIEDAVDELVKFSLIKRLPSSTNGGADSLSLHPLVQLMVRESYEDRDTIHHEYDQERQKILKLQGMKSAICLVGNAVEVRDHIRMSEDHWFEQRINPHIERCREYILSHFEQTSNLREIGDETLALSIHNLGFHYRWWFNYGQAMDFIQRAISLYKQIPLKTPAITKAIFRALANLAEVCYLGDLQCDEFNTLDVLEETWDQQKKLLGADHRDSLKTLDVLVRYIGRSADYPRALELQKQCVERSKVVLGPRDPDTVSFINNLGFIYNDLLMNSREAINYYEEALDLYQNNPRTNQIEIFICARNFAIAYWNLNKLSLALPLLVLAANGFIDYMGLTNKNTITTISYLISICRGLKNFEQAVIWAKRKLEAKMLLYGEQHIKVSRAIQLVEELEKQSKETSKEIVDCRSNHVSSEDSFSS